MGSQGILKSTDGGAHWTVLGADVFGPAYTEPAGQFPQYDAVGKVRVDPNNSNNVVAGTKKGLFFSYDGGHELDGPVHDERLHDPAPGHHRARAVNMGGGVTRIIAAVGVRGFATTVQYDLGQNGANGIYTATMPASGCPTFTSIACERERVRLRHRRDRQPVRDRRAHERGQRHAVRQRDDRRPARPDRHRGRAEQPERHLRAGAVDRAEQHGGSCGSAPRLPARRVGDHRRRHHLVVHGRLAGGSACSADCRPGDYPQNWYDQGIAVDPNNPDRVFVDTYDVWLATRTGTAFTDLTLRLQRLERPKSVHVDQHALAFVPARRASLLIGSDGGAFSTANADIAALPAHADVRRTWTPASTRSSSTRATSAATSPPRRPRRPPAARRTTARASSASPASRPARPSGRWERRRRLLRPHRSGRQRHEPALLRGQQQRRHVAAASRARHCLDGGAGLPSVTRRLDGDTQSFILPFDLFHGGIPGGDDCAPAGAPGGCGHLIAGTTRVWETIAGGNATMNAAAGTSRTTRRPRT